MSHLFQLDRVKLICSCGNLQSISDIYFCRYCLKLRCGYCVSHEIDSLFCPNCLENMPSTEARLKKNRCANCFDCPSCGHTLLSRTSNVPVPSAEDPKVMVAKKVYYLSCTSCRWTSRDVGIPDQTAATSGWGERDHPDVKRIQELFEHFRGVAQKEKFENERKKGSKRRTSYLNWMDSHGSLSSGFSLTRKSLNSLSLKGETSVPTITPSKAVDDQENEDGVFPHLTPETFTEPLNICHVTTMDQRLSVPEYQPESVQGLYPLSKHLLMKKTLRCRPCDHILCKPEYNPCSIKFKIQLGAYFHVPEIRMVREVALEAGKPAQIQLSVCNPTAHDMPVQLLPFSNQPADLEPIETEDDGQKSPPEPASLTGLPPGGDKDPLWAAMEGEASARFDPASAAKVDLPVGRFVVAAKDEALEYCDYEAAQPKPADQESPVIAWRKANKVGVNVTVTPSAEAGSSGSNPVTFAFLVRYDYKNTVATVSSVRNVTLTVPLVVNAGRLSKQQS